MSATLFLLSSFFIFTARATSYKLVLDYDPAPPADQGPAQSRNADRNPAHLKYEIIAICGAYAVWLSATLILIVVFRRHRHRKQQATEPPSLVTMKPITNNVPASEMYPSPVSPKKSPTWGSRKGPGGMLSSFQSGRHHKQNASEYTISTVTSGGDEAHRQKDMEALSNLYAHVMEQDEQKSLAETVTPITPRNPPPEFAHLQQSQALSHPLAPTPVDSQFPRDTHEKRSSRSTTRSSKTPLSIISEIGRQAGEVLSPRRPRHQAYREARISGPLESPELEDGDHFTDSVPLTPRLYNPGPPPPTPGSRQKMSYLREGTAEEVEPLSPRFAPEMPSVHRVMQFHPPSGSPQRERRAPPSSLPLRQQQHSPPPGPGGPQTAGLKPKALPFREVYGDSSLRSAPPTKTTFLEHPAKATGVSHTPRTGVVPQTPYSPYMPFTPMTPITPRRLATKDDLKRQRKQEKLKVLSEDDLVVDEDDMWGKVR